LSYTLRRLDQAEAYYEATLAFCRDADYAPEGAWACYDYARCLTARGHRDDQIKARSLLEEAQQISSNLGMRVLHERVVDFRKGSWIELNRRPDNLTPREVDVIWLVASGKTNKEIAHTLCISAHTAAAHVAHILSKNGWRNRTEAANHAVLELLNESSPRVTDNSQLC
jgi:DNA-binding NarL/FixJ family response regulator